MSPDHNPYSAPSAAVEDARDLEIRQRPLAVLMATALLGCYLLFVILGHIRAWNHYMVAGSINLILLGVQIAKWLVMTLVCFQLWRGRNWGRILLLVMCGFTLLSSLAQVLAWTSLPAGVNYAVDPVAIVMFLLPSLVYLVAVFLVFVPGRAWFARRGRA
jgi:hypothetical protein